MSKKFQFFITAFLSIIVLAACSTAENTTTKEITDETVPANTAATETVEDAVETKETEETEETETEEQVTEVDAPEEQISEQPKSNNNSTSITFSSKGETITEETIPVSGEHYTMQVLSGFTFTPEEPGKELLMYDEDDTISMRIEAITSNETTFSDLEKNTEETMTAISEDYQKYDIGSYTKDYNLTNSNAYIATFDTDEVITVIFEKDNELVRLTIYDNEKVDLSDAMIQMGLSIK